MKAILDTNVLVSAALSPGGTCDIIVQAALLAKFAACTTDRILNEYADVLSRPHLKLAAEPLVEVLAFFRDTPNHFPDLDEPLNLPDSSDEVFLAAALTAHAHFLVTGNLKHYPVQLR